MQKLLMLLQILTWFFAGCYFGLMTLEKLNAAKPTKNDIITQLEQQVNFELE